MLKNKLYPNVEISKEIQATEEPQFPLFPLPEKVSWRKLRKAGGSRAEVSAEKELYNMDSSPHLNIFKGNKMEVE